MVVGLSIDYRRRAPFLYMTAFNPDLTDVMMCNTNVVRVLNHRMGYYIGMYATKSKKEHANSLSELVLAGTRYLNWYHRTHSEGVAAAAGAAAAPAGPSDGKDAALAAPAASLSSSVVSAVAASSGRPAVQPIDPFRRYLGTMHASVRGHTEGEVVGGQIAAWLLLGNDLYLCSHAFGTIAPNAALSYFQTGNITGRVMKDGQMRSAMLNYMYRPTELEDLSWWEFVMQTERVRKSKSRRKPKSASDSDSGNSDDDKRGDGEGDPPSDSEREQDDDEADVVEDADADHGAGAAHRDADRSEFDDSKAGARSTFRACDCAFE